MIPPEVLRQVRRIEITTNRLVDEFMTGSYESTFRGRGMEFDEVREYQPGDDVRLIDWNVTARTGRPHIKRFIEERELTILFLVDLSRSMAFGSVAQLKRRIAAELCAVMAFSAIKHSDRVGVLLVTDHIERFIPPAKGSRHVLLLIREVLSHEPKGAGTDLAGGLDYLNRVTHQRAVVFVVSDFFAPGLQAPLALANRRHDVIALHLIDPRQEEMPPVGLVRLEDAETGQRLVLDTRDPAVRKRLAEWSAAHRQRVEQDCRKAGVDLVEIRTDRSYVEPLLRFFRMRALRR
jgi:uncharacterized protein (DUF58 family)